MCSCIMFLENIFAKHLIYDVQTLHEDTVDLLTVSCMLYRLVCSIVVKFTVTDAMFDSYRAGCVVHGQCEVTSKIANIKLYLNADRIQSLNYNFYTRFIMSMCWKMRNIVHEISAYILLNSAG